MACIRSFNFWAICGHETQNITHSDFCRNSLPEMQLFRQSTLALLEPSVCWSPLEQKGIPRFFFDVCGRDGCNLNRASPQRIELARESYKIKVERWEKAHRYDMKEKAKADAFKKDDRLLKYRLEKLTLEEDLRREGLKLKIVDLTLPREKILEGYLIAVDPPEEECMVCDVDFTDAPLDADGQMLPDGIKGQGVVRQMPCGCNFHLECIIRTLVTVTSTVPENGVGDRCPRCRRDTRVRFAVFNGVEDPIRRWYAFDDMPGGTRLRVGGVLDLPQTVFHRRKAHMRVVPFRTLEDQWGNFVSRAQAGT